MQLFTERLERPPDYVQTAYRQMREKSNARLDLLTAIETAFARRNRADRKRLPTHYRTTGGNQVVEMKHWEVPGLTLTVGWSFPWSLPHVTPHPVQVYLRKDGALVKRAISDDERATDTTSELDLEALSLEELRKVTEALWMFNPA